MSTGPAHAESGRDPASADHPEMTAADAEWVQELTAGWIETYKKSATTLVLLRIIRDAGAAPAAEIAEELRDRTGWTLTARGLYRTLRRLADARVLRIDRVDVARTGAKRQDFSLTPIGQSYLAAIEQAHKTV